MHPVRRRLTYANVVATLALVVALSTGGAWAASKLINGSKIKPHTITGKQVKKHSLASSVFKGKLPHGAPGQAGSTGPTGPVGPTGAAGVLASSASASAIGSISSATYVFAGTPASVTVASGDKVFVTGNGAFGSTAGPTVRIDVAICSQPASGGTLGPYDSQEFGLAAPNTGRVSIGQSWDISGLSAGAYKVGLCARATVGAADSNEESDSVALVHR